MAKITMEQLKSGEWLAFEPQQKRQNEFFELLRGMGLRVNDLDVCAASYPVIRNYGVDTQFEPGDFVLQSQTHYPIITLEDLQELHGEWKRDQELATEGYTLWKGGWSPVDKETYVVVAFRNGEREAGFSRIYNWHHAGNPLDIIAYLVVETAPLTDTNVGEPKRGGEFWRVVVLTDRGVFIHEASSKENAVSYARACCSDEVLAIIPTKQGTWFEGEGLELLEEKEGV